MSLFKKDLNYLIEKAALSVIYGSQTYFQLATL